MTHQEITNQITADCLVIDQDWYQSQMSTDCTTTQIITEAITNQLAHIIESCIDSSKKYPRDEITYIESARKQAFALDLMAMRINISVVPAVIEVMNDLEVN
jgi:hypothetical protein